MMTDKSNCTFNISGGNVQILPNATQGIQNFYGDQFAEEALKASVNTNPGNAAPELSDEEQALQCRSIKAIRFSPVSMHFRKRHRQDSG